MRKDDFNKKYPFTIDDCSDKRQTGMTDFVARELIRQQERMIAQTKKQAEEYFLRYGRKQQTFSNRDGLLALINPASEKKPRTRRGKKLKFKIVKKEL